MGGKCLPCRAERKRSRSLARLWARLFGERDSVRVIPIAKIEGTSARLRQSVGVLQFERLRRSIAGAGLVSPIVVRPLAHGEYAIVDGLRRWLAQRHLDRKFIPARVLHIDEAAAAQWRLAANLHREPLTDFDEARLFALVVRDSSLSRSELTAALGVDELRLKEMYERSLEERYRTQSWDGRTQREDSEEKESERQILDDIRRAARTES